MVVVEPDNNKMASDEEKPQDSNSRDGSPPDKPDKPDQVPPPQPDKSGESHPTHQDKNRSMSFACILSDITLKCALLSVIVRFWYWD